MGKNNRTRRKQKLAQKTAKRKRQQKRSEAKGHRQTFAPVYNKFHNPFGGLNDSQRHLMIEEVAKNSNERYQDALSNLRTRLRQHHPLLILSYTVSYGGKGLLQSHIEMLQALLLQINEPNIQHYKLLEPDTLKQIWGNLKTLLNENSFRSLSPVDLDLPDNEISILLAQRHIRHNTQITRNWGYHFQVKNIVRELYQPFDAQLMQHRGFSASSTFDIFETIDAEIEIRRADYIQNVQTLENLEVHNTDKHQMIENYRILADINKEETEQLFEDTNIEETSIETLHNMLLSHYDWLLPSIYIFNVSELAESTRIDKSQIKAILNEHSLKWGDLNEHRTEHLYLCNPVQKKPVIKLDDENFFCALSVIFFNSAIPCMEAILSQLKIPTGNQRAKYLESKVAEIVEKRFPTSNTKRNFKWVEDGTVYETDLVIFIDSFALVIECKSGKVTPPALRGAPDRLRRHIRELVIEPNLQSSRLKARIEFLSSNPAIQDPIRQEIDYDLSKVRKVVRASVCLEDLGTMQSNLKNTLENTGWLPTDFIPCPTMTLADFEIVFDILEHPVQILHYLIKREVIETSVNYLADEIDLLGLYLTTLLDIGEVEPENVMSWAVSSSALDTYYESLDADATPDKPQPIISPLFASIFSQLEQHKPARWTEIGVALNMFSPDDQSRFVKRLVNLKKRVRRNWITPESENTLFLTPSKASSYALACVMFKNENAGMQQHFMKEAAATALKNDHIQTVIVIGKNIDEDTTAYDAITLVESLASDQSATGKNAQPKPGACIVSI